MLKYTVYGTHASYVTVHGTTHISYRTNFREPFALSFYLRVHAQGDGINGRTHYNNFHTKITIQGCDNEANTISNPNENAWKTSLLNENPNRSWTTITVGGFTYTNAYCKLYKYTVTGTDAVYTQVAGSTFKYRSNIVEPKTLVFNLKVHAQGDGINGKTHTKEFPTTIKIQGCDNEGNTISNPNQNAWKTTVVNETPTRQVTNIAIGGFTYSNAFCKLLKYSIEGADASHITLHGTSKISYKTNYVEPRTLRYTLRVHAQGDGINGKTHQQTFPTTLKIQGCDNEPNTISNPNEAAWKTTVLNETPTRQVTDIPIGGFTYSNAYCKLLKYSLHGTDASEITLHGTSKISYQTNYPEPKTLSFTLRVHAQGDGINGKSHYKDYPTTIKIQGCDNEPNVISLSLDSAR